MSSNLEEHLNNQKSNLSFEGMDTVFEEATLPFSLLGPNSGQLLKDTICSSSSKCFPLKEDLILEELRHPEKKTGIHESCSPL